MDNKANAQYLIIPEGMTHHPHFSLVLFFLALLFTSVVIADQKDNPHDAHFDVPTGITEHSASTLDDEYLSTVHGKGVEQAPIRSAESAGVILWDEKGPRRGNSRHIDTRVTGSGNVQRSTIAIRRY